MRDVVVDAAGAAAYVTGVVAVMQHDRFRRQHLLAEACRHLAQTLRGMPRALGLDHRIVEAALAACCRELTDADAPDRTHRPRGRGDPTHRSGRDTAPAAALRPRRTGRTVAAG